jgi:hypothetical protein
VLFLSFGPTYKSEKVARRDNEVRALILGSNRVGSPGFSGVPSEVPPVSLLGEDEEWV